MDSCFKIINYLDCMDIYGTDKPDLRNFIKYDVDFSLFLFKNLFKNLNIKNIKTIIINNVYNLLKIDLLLSFLNNKNIYNYFCIYVYFDKNNIYKYKIFGNLNIDFNFIKNIINYLNVTVNTFISIILLKNNFSFDILLKIRDYYCNFFNLFDKNNFYPI